MFVQVEESLFDHPKSLALAALTGEVEAWPRMVRLWAWAMKYAPDGSLGRFAPAIVERAVCWAGEPGRWLAAAIEAGFIDQDLRIHDWMDHHGAWVEKMRKDRERKRTLRSAGKDVAGTSGGRPADGAGTARVPDPIRPDPTNPTDPTPARAPAIHVAPGTPVGESLPGVGSRRWEIPVLGSKSPAFLRVWDRYPCKAAQLDAAQAFARKAASFPGGEEALADAILAALAWQLETPMFRPKDGNMLHLKTYVEGERWTDERPAKRAAGPAPGSPPPASRFAAEDAERERRIREERAARANVPPPAAPGDPVPITGGGAGAPGGAP